MASTIEQSPYSSRRRDESEFSLREWTLRSQISSETTKSRRFSGSYIRSSFREDGRSFRSSIAISSTASSPGYSIREEIDPATYSFTTALKALQARAVFNSWECLSPEGFALNSKWNEAEKYICNPLSGEFPMECLSAKTLSGRSFRNFTNRITMSAPLVYSSSNSSRQFHSKPYLSVQDDDHISIQEKKMDQNMNTRDVGTQSTPPEISSSSPSPASTPPITETSLKIYETGSTDSPNCNAKLKEKGEQMEETRREEETTKKESDKEEKKRREEGEKVEMRRCSSMGRRQGGCLSWMRKRQREKHKPGNKDSKNKTFIIA